MREMRAIIAALWGHYWDDERVITLETRDVQALSRCSSLLLESMSHPQACMHPQSLDQSGENE